MRGTEELRPLTLEKNVQLHASGSCLVRLGRTHVLCAASLEAVSYTHLTLPTKRIV